MGVIGRPRAFDRDAALRAAMLVFWQKGFLGASMNDLCDAMGIRSPSLYAAFGSKEALYLEAVDHYATVIGSSVWGHLSLGATAREGVEAVLLAAANNQPQCIGAPRGCMVMSATIDEEGPGAILDTIRHIRLDCLDMLKARLAAGTAAGELPRSTDVDRLSRFYLAVFQGIALQARDGASTGELTGVAEIAMAAWPGG